MKPFVLKDVLILNKSLASPYFDYCSLVWDNCSNYSLDDLQKMQNRTARIITGKSYDVRSIDLLKKLNWLTLLERRTYQKAVFMFKVKNQQVTENVARMFRSQVTGNTNFAVIVKTTLPINPKQIS